jgi:arylformamidase
MTTTTTEKVFLDYTQEELDQAYDQTVWAPNFPELRMLNIQRSASVRERRSHQEAHYGNGEEETLEILPCGVKGAPVVLFVHGGRWMAQPENAFIYFAETIINNGAHFAAARFSTLTATPGPERMPDMVDQLRRAVGWLYHNARQFGGDPDQIHVIGHSSGAHLASVLLTTDWTKLGLPANIFKTGTCISGMYDLEPVLISNRSSYIKLNAVEDDEFSAMRHLDRLHCPMLVTHGDKESPEFQRHTKVFAAAMKEACHPHTFITLNDSNHFEGVASLYDPQSQLSEALLQHIGLHAA